MMAFVHSIYFIACHGVVEIKYNFYFFYNQFNTSTGTQYASYEREVLNRENPVSNPKFSPIHDHIKSVTN